MVLELGLNPDYVLDQIETYEINSLIKNAYKKHKNQWEQARLISYLIAQSNSTKKLKIEDIIEFHWEKEAREEQRRIENQVSNEELKQWMTEADTMREYMRNK